MLLSIAKEVQRKAEAALRKDIDVKEVASKLAPRWLKLNEIRRTSQSDRLYHEYTMDYFAGVSVSTLIYFDLSLTYHLNS